MIRYKNGYGEKMRKFLILLSIMLLGCSSSFAAKIPADVRAYILDKVPQADIRFDGVIIFVLLFLFLTYLLRRSFYEIN